VTSSEFHDCISYRQPGLLCTPRNFSQI
jgi:hypothetical protein